MGNVGHYRPGFFIIATPLINLTNKYARFKWIEDCQQSFDTLEEQLTTVLLLAYPDLRKLMILYTDANDMWIGACLTQTCLE